MIAILLCIYFGYQISVLTKRKNQNTVLWILATVFAFFTACVIATIFLVLVFYKGDMTKQEDLLLFAQNPIREIFVLFSGLGGYLLIRRILEKKPDIKTPKQEE